VRSRHDSVGDGRCERETLNDEEADDVGGGWI
jgi:hypothetical protein